MTEKQCIFYSKLVEPTDQEEAMKEVLQMYKEAQKKLEEYESLFFFFVFFVIWLINFYLFQKIMGRMVDLKLQLNKVISSKMRVLEKRVPFF